MKVELTCNYCQGKFLREKKNVKKNVKCYCSPTCQHKSQRDDYTMFRRLFHSSKDGAKRKGLDFDITLDHLLNLWENQEGKCALSGVDLYIANTQKEIKHGGKTASVDRIKNRHGYVPENIQLVHKDINFLKNDLDQDVFIRWCCRVAEHSGKTLDKPAGPDYNMSINPPTGAF